MVLLWSLYSMIMVWFYTTNLRGNLISKEYEKVIKTYDDVLNLDESVPVYLPNTIGTLEFQNPTLIKIIERARKSGTIIDLTAPAALSTAIKSVYHDGGIAYGSYETTLYHVFVEEVRNLEGLLNRSLFENVLIQRYGYHNILDNY